MVGGRPENCGYEGPPYAKNAGCDFNGRLPLDNHEIIAYVGDNLEVNMSQTNKKLSKRLPATEAGGLFCVRGVA